MTFEEWWRSPREIPQTAAAAREAWNAALSRASAPAPATPDHVPVSAEVSAELDAKLARIAEVRGLVIQAAVRELLEPSETQGASK